MFTITKVFSFSASHQLDHLPEDHKCARLHGHNYIVKVKLQATVLDKNGFVVDCGDLSPLEKYINEQFDHRHLNDVLGSGIETTAENLAMHLFQTASYFGWPIVGVGVSETPKTWAMYETDLPDNNWRGLFNVAGKAHSATVDSYVN